MFPKVIRRRWTKLTLYCGIRKRCKILLPVISIFAAVVLLKIYFYSPVSEYFHLSSDYDIMLKMEGPMDPLDPCLIALVRKRFLYPPSPHPYNLRQDGDEPFSILPSYSNFQNVAISYSLIFPIIKLLFDDQPPGFFIEAGAMDGEFISNTLYLEKEKGWTGLLVEPDVDFYKSLLSKNRKSWSTSACLSTKSYPFKTLLMKAEKSATLKVYSGGFNSLIDSRDFEKRISQSYAIYQDVQCLPVLTLLQAINVSKVNFFSLDVEDVEVDILETLPLDRINIESFAVEHRSTNHILGTIDYFIESYFLKWFESRGYKLYTFTTDSPHTFFFIKNSSELYKAFLTRPQMYNPEYLMLQNNITITYRSLMQRYK